MRVGELAKQTGVSTSKVRFYEARGLLPPAARLANGYRDYGEYDARVVAFISRAQSLGFTLREIANHLRSPDGEGRKARLLSRLEAKLLDLDAHIEEVRARRAVIAGLIAELREAQA